MKNFKGLLLIGFLIIAFIADAQKKDPVLYLRNGQNRTVRNIEKGYIEQFNKKHPATRTRLLQSYSLKPYQVLKHEPGSPARELNSGVYPTSCLYC
jgi:hypothetical protein